MMTGGKKGVPVPDPDLVNSDDELLNSDVDVKLNFENDNEEVLEFDLDAINGSKDNDCNIGVDSDPDDPLSVEEEPANIPKIRLKSVSALLEKRNPTFSASIQQKLSVNLTANKSSNTHVCIMSRHDSFGNGKDKCGPGKPLKMNLNDIVMHYYLHYRNRGYWDTTVPKTTPTDKDRIESYMCQYCMERFRNRGSEDPEPSRASFIYHLASKHGKIIDAMKGDPEVDMSSVLDLLKMSNPAMRDFIVDGTETGHDSNPAAIIEKTEWKFKQRYENESVNPDDPVAVTPLAAPSSSLSEDSTAPCDTPPTPEVLTYSTDSKFFPCPFAAVTACKVLVRNTCAGTLKLHLFQLHYLDYWKDVIPDIDSVADAKCDICAKKVPGDTPQAQRNSMICHRAVIHEELRDALEADPRFPRNLIEKMYNESSKKPPKVMYSKEAAANSSTLAGNSSALTVEITARSDFPEQTKNSRAAVNSTKKISKPVHDEASVASTRKYNTRKRKPKTFEDYATDSDEEWNSSEKRKLSSQCRVDLRKLSPIQLNHDSSNDDEI